MERQKNNCLCSCAGPGDPRGSLRSDLPHIGAVSAVSCDKRLETILFPGHREAALSESWAASLNRQTGMPVAVTAGIHYDGVTRADIEEIVKVTEEMRKQVMEKISLL